jgi:endonuclease/exonuclease/phosphatase family metal-dependent hydrolase
MKTSNRYPLFAFIMALICYTGLQAQTVKVMSYNIRLDHAGDGDNRWDNRKEQLAEQVQFYAPDFLGVQEALPNQMEYLSESFKGQYKSIGGGRDNGTDKGEFSAIFYNNKKYKLLSEKTFWLSTTPDVPSVGWDAALNRICTYGLFQEKQTGYKIWVFNTHFDHVGEKARAESAALILKKIKEVNTENLPFVLTGDFNLEPDSKPVAILKEHLKDAKDVAGLVFGPEGTFNAFEFTKPVTRRIDYIFVPEGIKVKKYAVLSDSENCRYLSDHLPVYAEIKLK